MATLAHPAASTLSRSPPRSRAPYLVALLLAAFAVAIGWVGFIASDDVSYHEGAVRWLSDPPFAGSDHWTTRYPLILTLAGAIATFGDGPHALAVTSLAWYAAFLLAGIALARRIGGAEAGWIAAVLLGTMPLAATAASIANCDLPEVAFLLLGVLLLSADMPKRAFAAGLSFGAAILCRETAVLGLAGLGLLFLLGKPLPRRILLIAAVGAAAVLAADLLFQWAMTGEPHRRYLLAFNHDSTIDRAANEEGNLLVHPVLDPLLVLLLNNEFGLLFPLAGAALLAGAARLVPAGGRVPLILLAAMSASAFLLVSLLGAKLVLNPRYFTIAAVAAAILVAIWLANLSGRPRLLLLAALIGSNLLLLSAQNAHPQWPAEALVAAARAHPGDLVEAAPAALHRAELPIRWHRIGNVRPLGSGGDMVLVAEAMEPPRGAILARYPVPPTPLGVLLGSAGLDRHLPRPIEQRLISPGQTQLLVRASGR